MNIALFSDCYHPIKNGVSVSVDQLKTGLTNLGHSVYIITVSASGWKSSNSDTLRLPSIRFGHKTDLRIALPSQKLIDDFLKDKDIEIVHTHTEFSLGWAGRAYAKKHSLPHFHTIHTLWKEYTHYFFAGKLLKPRHILRILSLFLRPSKALIFPSEKARTYYYELINDKQYKVIPNGISLRFVQSEKMAHTDQFYRKYSIPFSSLKLLFTGRLVKEKEVYELFLMISKIIKDIDNVIMIFVGYGPELTRIKNEAIDFGVSEKIIFTSEIAWEDIHFFYNIADIFVTASRSEIHPMTCIEAACSGLPMVVPNDAAYSNLVLHNINGFLVNSNQEFIARTRELIDSSELRRKFSKKSLDIAGSFTNLSYAKQVSDFYTEEK
ncbi:MAG: glycosyltransferase [Spirochaetia bacterium]